MSYSPMSFTTATAGRAGFVRLGTGVGGQADGTIVTTSVPNGVVTTSSYADPSWITSLSASKISSGSPTFTGLTVNQATSLNTTTINNGKLLLGLYDQLIETNNNEFSLASGASYTGTADTWTQNQPYLWSSRITQGQVTQVVGNLIRVQYTNTNASSVTWQDALKIDTSANTIIPTKTIASSITSGALQVAGGVGIGGASYFGGQTLFGSTLNASSTLTGAVQVAGGVGIGGSVYVGGLLTVNSSLETYTSPAISANAVTLNFNNGNIFALASNAANITANYTNVPTTTGQIIATALIITQGATAYIPNAVTINSVSQTIKWQGGSPPTGNANKTDIVSFTFICTGTTTPTVIGSLSTYG